MTQRKKPVLDDLEARWRKLLAQIDAQSHLLERQGCVASRCGKGRSRTWSLRFKERLPDGSKVQRSIYIGSDPRLVERVRELLPQYRMRALWADEAREFARFGTVLGYIARRS